MTKYRVKQDGRTVIAHSKVHAYAIGRELTDTTMNTETVYVIQGSNKHKECYHNGKNACNSSKAAENFEQLPKSVAEDRGLRHCKWCAGDVDTSAQDLSYQHALQEAAADD